MKLARIALLHLNAFLVASALPALAQQAGPGPAYPVKPVRMIVPSSSGERSGRTWSKRRGSSSDEVGVTITGDESVLAATSGLFYLHSCHPYLVTIISSPVLVTTTQKTIFRKEQKWHAK